MPWNVSKYSHGSKLLVDIFDVHPQLGGAISHDDEDEILIKLISNYNCWTVGLLVNLFVESGSWFSLVASSINLFSVIPNLHVSSFAFNLFSTQSSRFAHFSHLQCEAFSSTSRCISRNSKVGSIEQDFESFYVHSLPATSLFLLKTANKEEKLMIEHKDG